MNWLKSNWRLKLVAFAIATVTWFFVNNITNDRRLVQAVPLEVRTKAGVLVLQQSVSLVDVEIRGTRNDVRQVTRDDLLAVVDLNHESRTGELSYRVGPSAVLHPRWVQPVDVSPGRVTVVIDEMTTRELTVQPQITGELPAGFVIERVELHPQQVSVRGPKSRLEQLPAIRTLPIDVTGRRTSFRERVEVTADALAELSDRRWVEVDVRIHEQGSVDTPSSRGVEEGRK